MNDLARAAYVYGYPLVYDLTEVGYEAGYFATYVDDRGEQLTGSRRYRIHFDRTPPVDAF
jgi:hypothetical protein